MYGVPNSSSVNDVHFYLFSKTYQSKKSDDSFEKNCRSFDSLSLPPCKAELYQHLLRVRTITTRKPKHNNDNDDDIDNNGMAAVAEWGSGIGSWLALSRVRAQYH
ncbi:hypothetical protein TNCV_2033691 [Trichonephila clavipes]|nr:hypothetical protein TNCV_2033691 [Trichonephila clavipes]